MLLPHELLQYKIHLFISLVEEVLIAIQYVVHVYNPSFVVGILILNSTCILSINLLVSGTQRRNHPSA